MGPHKIPKEDQTEIVRRTRRFRQQLSIGEETPIGNDLQEVLRRLDITLLEQPIPRAGSNSFSAILLQTKMADKSLFFLGLNTEDFYDKQLFAIAHELYHYLNRDSTHISRSEVPQTKTEQMADWFAAELLLPLQILQEQVKDSFGKIEVSGATLLSLLRFIARLHCTWCLPYKSIVHRLYEADAISAQIYETLFSIDERDKGGPYWRIGMATSPEAFSLLNTVTRRTGTDSANLEPFLRNYEDGIVDEEELVQGLRIFGHTPADFGISFLDSDDAGEAPGGEPDDE